MEIEGFSSTQDAMQVNSNKEAPARYKIIGVRQDEAPGSFTGFGLYYPVLKDEAFPANIINEQKGFDPGLSYRNVPVELLFENGIDVTRKDEVQEIVDLLSEYGNFLTKDDVIARYSSDFAGALKVIGEIDLKFDLVTPKGESLKIMNVDVYSELGDKYDKRAREVLINELSSSKFGNTTETLIEASKVLAGNRVRLDKENMILYNIYALHALDFDQAVRYQSTNRLFLNESIAGVKKTLISYYRKIKESGAQDHSQDDVDRFEYLLEVISQELDERDSILAEKIKRMKVMEI